MVARDQQPDDANEDADDDQGDRKTSGPGSTEDARTRSRPVRRDDAAAAAITLGEVAKGLRGVDFSRAAVPHLNRTMERAQRLMTAPPVPGARLINSKYVGSLPKTSAGIDAGNLSKAFALASKGAAFRSPSFTNVALTSSFVSDAAKLASIKSPVLSVGSNLRLLRANPANRHATTGLNVSALLTRQVDLKMARIARLPTTHGAIMSSPALASVASSISRDHLGIGQYSSAVRLFSVPRIPALIATSDLQRLLETARTHQSGAVAADVVLRAVATSTAYDLPPPVDESGFLVDDGVAVSEWVAQIASRVLSQTGLTDRDLGEDAVAFYVYALTLSVVLLLLLQFPLIAAVGGLLGVAAHPPAKIASRFSRRVYQEFQGESGPEDDVP